MLEEKIRQTFRNNSNCYADSDSEMVIQAMDENCFVTSLMELNKEQQQQTAELLEALKYANRMLKNSKDAMYDHEYVEGIIVKHTT